MIFKITTFIVVGIIVLILSSCKVYKTPKSIVMEVTKSSSTSSAASEFSGINKLIKSLNQDEILPVMLVHGMGEKKISDFDQFVENISNFLHLEHKGTYIFNLSNHLKTSKVLKEEDSPSVKVFKYEGVNNQNKKVEVRFVFLYWSPATKKIKNYIKNADSVAIKSRAKFNHELKKSVVLEGFGDVVALNEKFVQEVIFKSFEFAFLLRNIDISSGIKDLSNISYDNIKSTVLVSGSFGSKLTYEYIINYLSYTQGSDGPFNTFAQDSTQHLYCNNTKTNLELINAPKADAFCSSLVDVSQYWFLLSNQLTLLNTTHYNFSHLDGYTSNVNFATDSNKNIEDVIKSNAQRLSHSISLVSFYDPNDMLGFYLPREQFSGENYAENLINISIPIQRRGLLGFANPIKAHSGSKYDIYVLNMIANGWDGEIKSLPSKKVLRKLRLHKFNGKL